MQNIEDEIALKIKQSLQSGNISSNIDDGKIKCEYCGTYYSLKEKQRCPNCGAVNTLKENHNG